MVWGWWRVSSASAAFGAKNSGALECEARGAGVRGRPHKHAAHAQEHHGRHASSHAAPVPRSTMMCLFLKKNITVQGSYSSYIVLKSGTSEMSTCV